MNLVPIPQNNIRYDHPLSIPEYLDEREIPYDKNAILTMDDLCELVNEHDTNNKAFLYFPIDATQDLLDYISETNAIMCLVTDIYTTSANWFEL